MGGGEFDMFQNAASQNWTEQGSWGGGGESGGGAETVVGRRCDQSHERKVWVCGDG